MKCIKLSSFLLLICFLVLYSFNSSALELSQYDYGEQMGVYLGSAYAADKLLSNECSNFSFGKFSYGYAIEYINKISRILNLSKAEVNQILNLDMSMSYEQSKKSVYFLQNYHGKDFACGYSLGILFGIMEESQAVIDKSLELNQ